MKRLLFVFTSFWCPFFLFSQTADSIPAKRWSVGILLGSNNTLSKFDAYSSSEIGLSRDYFFVEAGRGSGIDLGVYISYPLNSYFILKTEPSFTISAVHYDFDLPPSEPRFGDTREFVNVELPLHLLFEPHSGRIAPSYVIGARYVRDFATAAQNEDPENFRFKKNDFMLDAGIGLNTYFQKFNVRYEFSYSKGLLNQVDAAAAPSLNNPFSEVHNDRMRIRLIFYK